MSADSYETYLHQRPKRRPRQHHHHHAKSFHHLHNEKQQPSCSLLQEVGFGGKIRGEVKYYPVERVVKEWGEREVRETVPVHRKKIEMEERRTVERVPREVIKTDYYAVQHLRSYLKQVVPQVVVEKRRVPKTVTHTELTPTTKQIIYYPPFISAREAPETARAHLSRQGVNVLSDASFRPLQPSPTASPSRNNNMGINVYQVSKDSQPVCTLLPQSSSPVKCRSRFTQQTSITSTQGKNYPRYEKERYQRWGDESASRSLLLSGEGGRKDFSFGRGGTRSQIFRNYLYGKRSSEY